MSEEVRFRGSWTPVVARGAVVASEEEGYVVKVVAGDTIRLVEIEEPVTLAALVIAVEAATGLKSPALSYCLPNDDDDVSLETDADLRLAQRFGGQPLKVYALPGDVFECAASALEARGVDCPARELQKILSVLQLSPMRLVKTGLAPPYIKTDAWEQVDDSESVMGTDDDAVVAVFRAKGVALAPRELHAVLRVLNVQPKRFVKLGLVPSLDDARAAYETADALDLPGKCPGKKHPWGAKHHPGQYRCGPWDAKHWGGHHGPWGGGKHHDGPWGGKHKGKHGGKHGHWGGPPFMHGGPPHMHGGPPPMHGGPPHMHGGPPPMHGGPPRGPPMMHFHHHHGPPSRWAPPHGPAPAEA